MSLAAQPENVQADKIELLFNILVPPHKVIRSLQYISQNAVT